MSGNSLLQNMLLPKNNSKKVRLNQDKEALQDPPKSNPILKLCTKPWINLKTVGTSPIIPTWTVAKLLADLPSTKLLSIYSLNQTPKPKKNAPRSLRWP